MTDESISNKLSELFDLFKSGTITKEEYETLKSEIIGSDKVQFFKEQIQEHEPELQTKELLSTSGQEPEKEIKRDPAKPVTGPYSNSNKRRMSAIIIVMLFGIIIIFLLLVKSFKDYGKLANAHSLSDKRISQLSADSLIKADSISALYKKIVLLYSDNMSAEAQGIPIPEEIQGKILIVNKYQSNRIPPEATFYQIDNGKSYELHIKDQCSEYSPIVYTIASLFTDTWQYITPECGSGGNSSSGTILFTSDGFMETIKFSSCSGASDCYEYLTVLVNSNQIYHTRTKL